MYWILNDPAQVRLPQPPALKDQVAAAKMTADQVAATDNPEDIALAKWTPPEPKVKDEQAQPEASTGAENKDAPAIPATPATPATG